MWSVTDALIKEISAGNGKGFVTEVEVSAAEPYLDIDLIGEVTLTQDSDAAALIDRTLKQIKRYRAPQKADEGASHLLINCGGFTVAPRELRRQVWVPLFEELVPDESRFLSIPGRVDVEPEDDDNPYYKYFYSRFVQRGEHEVSTEDPVATLVSVNVPDRLGVLRPAAIVAIIGFDSNQAFYRTGKADEPGQVPVAQLERARELVEALTHTVASDTPLYVIGVTHHSLLPVEDHLVEGAGGSPQTFQQGSLNAFGLLHDCASMRASLIVNTHMHAREVHSLATLPVEPGRTVDDITIVACPSFDEVSGRRTSGLAHVRLNVWRGEAEIGYVYSDPDGPAEPRLTQVIRPLVSASRVSAAEQRLHTSVKRLLAEQRELADEKLAVDIDRFEDHVDKVWRRDGYVPLTFEDGTLPAIRETRFVRYNLLLLLRRRPDAPPGSEYELLTSHHTPLRPPRLADWTSLLLPAFTNVRNLLEHLRDDVVRQVADQAGDLRKARAAKRFEEAVENIFSRHTEPDRDVWEESLREVATMTQRKISPTTGQVTEYEYHLMTMLPLIEKGGDDDDKAHIREWLEMLPAIRPDLPETGRPNCVPIEAIENGGAGLRWEPSVELRPPLARDPRAAFKLPPGAIWYPVPTSDEVTGQWTRSPAIVSRNADVMRWVDKVLAGKRTADGGFPVELLLEGATAEERHEITVEAVHSFEETRKALSNVTYDVKSDLYGRKAYEGKDIVPVYLVRAKHGNKEREAIVVLDKEGNKLGALRPVQRYVRIPGIERAEAIYQRLARLQADKHPGYEEFGYVEARKGPAAKAVSITPPIVEQVSFFDTESDDPEEREFLLCDGNHRVVNSVWRHGRKMAAVAVLGEPNEPYYARPFGTFEWQCTSNTEVTVTVDNNFKYNARVVDEEVTQSLSAEALEKVHAIPESLRYRRYYRDLNSGFGDVGGQGGAY